MLIHIANNTKLITTKLMLFSINSSMARISNFIINYILCKCTKFKYIHVYI